ncbi:hypothetical protein KKC47_01920, partial [Patescibacteria group bacterium]|nr:hypothetical protein [Patescibacteria group bacterium]
ASTRTPDIVRVDLSPFQRDSILGGFSVGEQNLSAVAYDNVNGFAYYATDTAPAKVIKVRLSDFSRVDSITLESEENYAIRGEIDTTNGFAYFTLNTVPGKVVKIDLSDFTRSGVVTFNTGENTAYKPLIDVTNQLLYVSTYTSPGKIVKINLATFSRVGVLTFASGDNQPVTGVIDVGNQLAYFGCFTSPGKVVKVNLSTFTASATLTMETGENRMSSAVIDIPNQLAYFGTSSPALGYIIKVNLSDLTRVGAIATLESVNDFDAADIDLTNGYAYFFGDHGLPGLLRIRLSDFTAVDVLDSRFSDLGKTNAFIDISNGYLYGGSKLGGIVTKISITPKPALRLEYGLNTSTCDAISDWRIMGSGAWSMSDSTYVTNGSTTTNLAGVTDGNSDYQAGYVQDTSALTSEVQLQNDDFTEIEYSIKAATSAVDGASYCFRVTDAGSATGFTFTNYAQATITGTYAHTLNNAITLSRLQASATSVGVSSSFALSSEQSTPLTITFPYGFTVTGPFTAGDCSGGGEIGTFAYSSSTLTAEKTGCSGTVTLSGATVTNPSSTGAYTISWVNDDPGYAMVYIVDSDQVSITSNVDPTLTFDIDTSTSTAADTSAPYSVAFGTLDVATTNVSGEGSINYILIDLDTNATQGAVVTIQNANGSSGLVSASSSDTVASLTNSMSTGNENYGFCVQSVSQSSGGTLAKAGDYTSGTCTDQADTNAVKGLSTTASNILSVSGPVAGGRAVVSGSAAISVLTEAHDDYTDTLTFVATSTF